MQKINIDYDRDNLYIGLEKLPTNKADVTYADGKLSEFNIHRDEFDTNLDFEYCCYGVLNDTVLPMHVDDGRLSTLIIPLSTSELSLTTKGQTFTVTEPFIIDTTILHSTESQIGYSFLSLDFNLSYDELLKHLDHITELYIKYVE